MNQPQNSHEAMVVIKRLSAHQRDTLGQIAMHCDWGHHPATFDPVLFTEVAG